MRKERPILFSTQMVQALLVGRKTQTRRILKLKHLKGSEETIGAVHKDGSGKGWIAWVPGRNVTAEQSASVYPGEQGFKCPFGDVGDLLWVRETWGQEFGGGTLYKASHSHIQPDGSWKPSIHMHKERSRIWLEITDIRVERANDISEADAQAEGIIQTNSGDSGIPGVWYKDYFSDCSGYGDPNHDFPIVSSPVESFKTLWQSINGPESWDANPWVWAITFKVLSTTGKP